MKLTFHTWKGKKKKEKILKGEVLINLTSMCRISFLKLILQSILFKTSCKPSHLFCCHFILPCFLRGCDQCDYFWYWTLHFLSWEGNNFSIWEESINNIRAHWILLPMRLNPCHPREIRATQFSLEKNGSREGIWQLKMTAKVVFTVH